MIENYSQLSIKKLPIELRKNGFTYRLVKRNENRMIYSQHSNSGEIIAYEMFLNKLRDQRKAKARWAKLQHKEFVPENYEEFYEAFPSDEEFGSRAWTYRTLEDAQKAFDSK